MNFLLAFILFAALALTQGVPDSSRPGAVVKAIVPGSPAEQPVCNWVTASWP